MEIKPNLQIPYNVDSSMLEELHSVLEKLKSESPYNGYYLVPSSIYQKVKDMFGDLYTLISYDEKWVEGKFNEPTIFYLPNPKIPDIKIKFEE